MYKCLSCGNEFWEDDLYVSYNTLMLSFEERLGFPGEKYYVCPFCRSEDIEIIL